MSLTKYDPAAIEAVEKAKLAEFTAQGFNVLVPVDSMRRVSPFYMARSSVVQLSMDPRDEDVYGGPGLEHNHKDPKACSALCGAHPSHNVNLDYLKEGERALRKNGLQKLAEAAGVDYCPEFSKREDDGKRPGFCQYKVVLKLRKPDGSYRYFPGTEAIDLDLMEKGGAKIPPALRKKLVATTETKAYNRAIRAALKIKQKYTVAELQKPFVVFALDFFPDYDDPAVRQLMLMGGQGAVERLMGRAGGGAEMQALGEVDAARSGQPALGDGGKGEWAEEAADEEDEPTMEVDEPVQGRVVDAQAVVQTSEPFNRLMKALGSAKLEDLPGLVTQSTAEKAKMSKDEWATLCKAHGARKAELKK